MRTRERTFLYSHEEPDVREFISGPEEELKRVTQEALEDGSLKLFLAKSAMQWGMEKITELAKKYQNVVHRELDVRDYSHITTAIRTLADLIEQAEEAVARFEQAQMKESENA